MMAGGVRKGGARRWRLNGGDKEVREGVKEQNISLKERTSAAAAAQRRLLGWIG